MTNKEINKIKSSLPKWTEQNEEEKKLDNELDCRSMINSILIYGYLNNTIDEIYENKYLKSYKKDISETRLKELIKEQQEDLKKSKINQDVYTDGEGVTYNSVSWYDEEKQDNDKKEESNSKERYPVNQKYKDMFIEYCKDKIIDVPKTIKFLNPDYDEDEADDEDYDEEKYLVYDTDETDVYMYEDGVYTIIPDDIGNPISYDVTEDGEYLGFDYSPAWADRLAELDYIGISKYTYEFVVNNWTETNWLTEVLNLGFEEKYGKVEESKELRKYNSRLYGVYDTEKEEYTDTGTLEDMKNEVEDEKEDVEEKQEEPKEDKKDININITVKNESKVLNESFYKGIKYKVKLTNGNEYTWIPGNDYENQEFLNELKEKISEINSEEDIEFINELNENKEIKTESLEDVDTYVIINPDDKFYKDEHLYEVLIYPGVGVEMIPYYIYANYEQDALELLLPYLLENAPGLVYDISDLEEEDLDNYITVDGIHYLNYNTQIEELEGKKKDKIEGEFFKNYKEEE